MAPRVSTWIALAVGSDGPAVAMACDVEEVVVSCSSSCGIGFGVLGSPMRKRDSCPEGSETIGKH